MLKHNEQCCKKFLATSLDVTHNYFVGPIKLFLDLRLIKFFITLV